MSDKAPADDYQVARMSVGGKAPRTVRVSRGGKKPRNVTTNKSKISNEATTTSAPRIHDLWYQSAKFSDLTIKYGPVGNGCLFYAHRVILCNASEWFLLFLDSASPTANDRYISLQDDDREGMEALLEYCYRGEYASLGEIGTYGQTTKDGFMRHAKSLIVATKYMVDGLASLATQRIEKLLQEEISAGGSGGRIFFKFVVEAAYLREHEFGYDQDAVDEGAHPDALVAQHVDRKLLSKNRDVAT